MSDERCNCGVDGCEGPGRCHGCMAWCDHCGDVDHVCDVRDRGDRCDAHPKLPRRWELQQELVTREANVRQKERELADAKAEQAATLTRLRQRIRVDMERALEDARLEDS